MTVQMAASQDMRYQKLFTHSLGRSLQNVDLQLPVNQRIRALADLKIRRLVESPSLLANTDIQR